MRLKRGDIVRLLRDDIIKGKLKPGDTVPPRPELITRFQSTSATVQHAMDILSREGFIYVNESRRTLVAMHPPHLYRFAMVFHDSPQGTATNRFFSLLAAEARHYSGTAAEPRRISIHYGVENHVDNKEWQTLVNAVRMRSLAGLIFPENPFATGLAASPLGTEPGIPRIMLSPNQNGWGYVQLRSMHDKAISHLATQGCRRIGVLTAFPYPSNFFEDVTTLIRVKGMETRPCWQVAAPLTGAICARSIMNLLFQNNQVEKPDGLFISNDNLVEDALAGVVASGTRVPDQLQIVAHCNFPWPVVSAVPVTRVGYSSAEILKACMDEITSQRQGNPSGSRIVEPRFESEFTAAQLK